MPAKSPKDVIAIAEVARRIDRSEATLRRWIADGQFPGYRTDNAYTIPIEWYRMWCRGEWTPRKQDKEVAA